MPGVFYTYVWGRLGARGGPLIFTSKQNRTLAIHGTQEGDLVFGVVSRNPGDPNVVIPEERKGRVQSVWQISHITADTVQFGIEAEHEWDKLQDGSYRWPFALQPIRTWIISDPPLFRELSGYTSSVHTQRAIISVQQVGGELADTLIEFLKESGEELEVMMPQFESLSGNVRLLCQKHPFAQSGYAVRPDPDANYYVYIATLGKAPPSRTVKIGHAKNSLERVRQFNKFRLSTEPQWVLHGNQFIGPIRKAIAIEEKLGQMFSQYRTEPNNNEVYIGPDADQILSALAMIQIQDPLPAR